MGSNFHGFLAWLAWYGPNKIPAKSDHAHALLSTSRSLCRNSTTISSPGRPNTARSMKLARRHTLGAFVRPYMKEGTLRKIIAESCGEDLADRFDAIILYTLRWVNSFMHSFQIDIITDSTCDIPQDLVDQYKIRMIAHSGHLGCRSDVATGSTSPRAVSTNAFKPIRSTLRHRS